MKKERRDDSRWPDPAVQDPRAIALLLTAHITKETRGISPRRGESVQDAQETEVPLWARVADEANSLSLRCGVTI